VASGLTPLRKNWSGLLPVPGDTGEYEWSGFLPFDDLPRRYNPPEHSLATANHNILPAGYRHQLGYEWAPPFRFQRVREMLAAGGKFTVADFERMQQDVTSAPARRFQKVLGRWRPAPGSREAAVVARLSAWDARLTTDSVPATIYALWVARLPQFVFGRELGLRTDLSMLLATLEARHDPKALEQALGAALEELTKNLGPDMDRWTWGRVHHAHFRHPLNATELDRGPVSRPGDATTVNNTSPGAGFRQTSGASYRHILDLSDWDKSVATNTPGESGDPASPTATCWRTGPPGATIRCPTAARRSRRQPSNASAWFRRTLRGETPARGRPLSPGASVQANRLPVEIADWNREGVTLGALAIIGPGAARRNLRCGHALPGAPEVF